MLFLEWEIERHLMRYDRARNLELRRIPPQGAGIALGASTEELKSLRLHKIFIDSSPSRVLSSQRASVQLK